MTIICETPCCLDPGHWQSLEKTYILNRALSCNNHKLCWYSVSTFMADALQRGKDHGLVCCNSLCFWGVIAPLHLFKDNEICASCQNMHFNILLYFGFGKVCGFLSGMFSLQCLIIEELPQGSSAEYSALLKWKPLLVGAFYQRTSFVTTAFSNCPVLPTRNPSILLRI